MFRGSTSRGKQSGREVSQSQRVMQCLMTLGSGVRSPVPVLRILGRMGSAKIRGLKKRKLQGGRVSMKKKIENMRTFILKLLPNFLHILKCLVGGRFELLASRLGASDRAFKLDLQLDLFLFEVAKLDDNSFQNGL